MSRAISSEDIETFRAAIARCLGLRFGDDKLGFLGELLDSRLQATGCPSVEGYLLRLGGAGDELAVVASSLVVSETYFLRNREQFRAFEALLLERQRTSSRDLRLISAGCASGEEAYSLAISIRETLQHPEEWRISILGVDLNPDSIQRARAASYTRWSLRETPDNVLKKYFRERGDRYTLSQEILDMVRFERQNLAQPRPGLWGKEAFDVVFCRNVLMYFTPEAMRQVVASIARSLAPGAHLFLGHAENLRGISDEFHLKHSHATFYYERKTALASAEAPAAFVPGGQPAPTPLPEDVSWFEAIARATNRIEHLSRSHDVDLPAPESRSAHVEAQANSQAANDLSPALDLMQQERFQEALRALLGAPDAASPEPDALLLRAMLLVSTNDVRGAEDVCSRLLLKDEFSAGAHYITALCREHLGDTAGAIEHCQAAIYLDAEFAMPRLQLGRMARRTGNSVMAERELNAALRRLPCEDPARILLFGGGFGRQVLIDLCQGELEACRGAR